jgi:general secretion pathway protein H
MRISAVGKNDRKPQLGFTLVELMVVMAILAMATGAVLLSLPTGDADARAEAERVAARLSLARDLAISDSRPRTLIFKGARYAIEGEKAQDWEVPDGGVISGASSIRFDATGSTDADTQITVQVGTSEAVVQVDAGGEVHVAP